MQSLSKILLPVDFSERSAGAARYAKALAARFQPELTLLHVLPPPEIQFGSTDMSGAVGGTMLAEVYRCRSDQASRELDVLVAAELAGLNVRRVVLEGDPATRIVEYAHEQSSDIIIMPTHGYGPFRRFILGSNTAKVLHDADCPVWTGVHIQEAPAAATIPFRSILCAVDMGPQSSKTLCWAALLAQEFGARLTLVHAIGCAPEPADSSEASMRNGLRAAAEAELQRLREFVRAEADLIIESGEPARVICAAAERLHADVLVIGRGSAAGVFGRLRTNAYAIIRQSPCPVVSV